MIHNAENSTPTARQCKPRAILIAATAILLAIIAAGCATPTDRAFVQWSDYEGQPLAWPLGTHSFVRRVGQIEIYGRDEFPARPYTILGKLRLGTSTLTSESEDHALERVAREKQIDAYLLEWQGSDRTPGGTLVTVWQYYAARYNHPDTQPSKTASPTK